MVRFGRVGKLIRRARKENQVVAAGPKITVGVLAEGGLGEGGGRGWGTAAVEGHAAGAGEVVL